MKTIEIYKSDVMQEMELLTGYVAGKSADNVAAFDRVATDATDTALLNLYMENAILTIHSLIPDSLLSTRFDDRYQFTIKTDWKDTDFESIEIELLRRHIFSAIVALTSAKWLRLVGSTLAPTAQAQAENSLKAITKLFDQEDTPDPIPSLTYTRSIP